MPMTTEEVTELMGQLGEVASARFVDSARTSVRVTYRYRDSRRQPLIVSSPQPELTFPLQSINI